MELLLFMILFFATAGYAARSPPTLIVDLDRSPEERWLSVIKYYNDTSPDIFESIAAHWQNDTLARLGNDKRSMILAAQNRSEEEMSELQGYSRASGIPLDTMMFMSIMYEVNFPSFACSGVLAAKQDGEVVHGRNMDYGDPFWYKGRSVDLQDFTIDVTFHRQGIPIITSVTWPGQIGVHTAMRFDGWTFEQNTRMTNSLPSNLAAMNQEDSKGFAFQVRKLMEEIPDFESAVNALNQLNLAAPQYFIVAGAKPFEGAVITRDRAYTHESFTPPIMRLNREEGQWFIVQTNDDLNADPLDERRSGATRRLDVLGQAAVSEASVQQLMNSPSLLRPNTIFTWIADPATGLHRTQVHSKEETTAMLQASSFTLSRKRAPRSPSHLGLRVRLATQTPGI